MDTNIQSEGSTTPKAPPKPRKKRKPRQKKAVDMKIEERRLRVAELILQDYTQRQIAEMLSCSVGTVNEDVAEIEADWKAQRVLVIEEKKAKQDRRLQRLRRAAWKRVDDEEKGAVRDALAVEAEYNKLYGLYAPATMEITSGGEPLLPVQGLVSALLAAQKELDNG